MGEGDWPKAGGGGGARECLTQRLSALRSARRARRGPVVALSRRRRSGRDEARGEARRQADRAACRGSGARVQGASGRRRHRLCADAVEAALADLDLAITFNSKFATGLASSLKAGLAATAPDVAGALVLLGDMPWIEPELIDALIGAFLAREGALAAVPLREGRRGNPVLLGRGLFEAAMSLEGDEGARRLICALSPGELVEVEASDMSVTHDIDTPDDLAAARRFHGGS